MIACTSTLLLMIIRLYTVVAEGFQVNHLEMLQQCDQSGPLGMITGEIQDWQISASSTYPHEWDKDCHERYARVYQSHSKAWCSRYKSSSEWLQIDLGVPAKITGVMIQGRVVVQEWVSAFMLSHSMDAFYWQYITDIYGNQRVFEGNSDAFTTKHLYLDEPILARFIKFHTTRWNKHPSMRVEILGCQVCKSSITLPPYAKIAASSEKLYRGGVSCRADDGYTVTSKAWCAKDTNANQWLQYDIGPPTLVTGVETKGRGDTGKKHWVTKFRLSYSNDSVVWYFYKDAIHLEPKEFGGNVDKNIERYHYLNSPFVARYIRFHPIEWHRRISMRAGLIGCPFKGECSNGFIRLNKYTPCVENLAYKKESWINDRRQHKRHIRQEWKHGQASRVVDGNFDQSLHSCMVLDNFYVDKPVLMVDLGKKTQVSGIILVTWQGNGQDARVNYREYMYNLEKLVVYVDNKGGMEDINLTEKTCGSVTRLNNALFKPTIHLQCAQPTSGRYVYIEAWGVANRFNRLFSAVLCEIVVYQ